MTTIARLGEETVRVEAVDSEKAVGRAEAPSLGAAFAQCADGLYRFILVRVGGDRDAADELLQECCHAAVSQRRLPGDSSVWSAWFAGIAKNLIRRHWRQRRRAQHRRLPPGAETVEWPAGGIASGPLPEEELLSSETLWQLMTAVSRMSQENQDLLLAFYFDGRSQADIAAELRTTVKAVEVRLRRARERLRKKLGCLEERDRR